MSDILSGSAANPCVIGLLTTIADTTPSVIDAVKFTVRSPLNL